MRGATMVGFVAVLFAVVYGLGAMLFRQRHRGA